MSNIQRLASQIEVSAKVPTFGVCATSDPRIDEQSRQRCINIIEMAANVIGEAVQMPDGTPANVVYSPILIDGEPQADMVARQFKEAGVDAIVCVPDTWAFPQPSLISLIAQFPKDIPINLTCGNSGPKPGVVFVHACSGAISQYGKLVHINVGTWPAGMNPQTGQRH